MSENIISVQRPGEIRLGALPPLALYVHLPWCLKKCPYCDFNSHASDAQALPEARYLDALRADLESALPLIWGRSVHSIFIGGGTPSLFSPDGIDQLLGDLRARLRLDPACEVTLEANPGTFERTRFRAFRQAGVTRLSIGVQSFNDDRLKALGRVHDAAQARAAVEEAALAFETFNIDLMYALPGQTLPALESDLATALSYGPPHLSLYQLTLEPNTYFAKFPPKVPDEDTSAQMLDLISERTALAGLERYEVSAYARPGHRCRHNLNYWRFGDYLGIGAGAHGKLSFEQRVIRQVRHRDPGVYMAKALAGSALAQEREVTAEELPFEFMLNALRLKDGFEFEDFTERTGLPVRVIEKTIQQAVDRQLLVVNEKGHVAPTARGFDFLSDLQEMFLPD